MEPSTARGLAGAGALLCIASLLTPWFVLRAGPLSAQGMSGAEALGARSWLLIALALAAGCTTTARAHRLVPPVAASALALVVAWQLVSPPSPTRAFPTAGSPDDVSAQITTAFEGALTHAVRMHYARTWGIWIAAFGAALVLVGALGRRAPTEDERSGEAQRRLNGALTQTKRGF